MSGLPNQPIEIQERDLRFLRGLFESRILTTAHASTLYFEGKDEAAKKRIQKLKNAGIVAERPRRLYEPSILYLTKKAFRLLHENGILSLYPAIPLVALEKRAHVSSMTLAHELEVVSVKAAFARVLADHTACSLAEFSTWPLLSQFKACQPPPFRREVVVKPDGFLRIHERDAEGTFEHSFFLEVDRSTETQQVLALRCGAYMDYYRSGGFAVRNGQPRSAYKDFPFWVLVVCKSAERRDNAARRLLEVSPPILTQVWLTTFKEASENPLGHIWVTPSDFQQPSKTLNGGNTKRALFSE